MARKVKQTKNCFKCTQQFWRENRYGPGVRDYTGQKKFKQTRAQGECLGIRSRRKTWQAAISCGELQISFDPQISECGNTYDEESYIINWIHRLMRGTLGTETSKYQEEEKSTEISRVVASESERGQTKSSNTLGVRTSISNLTIVEWRGKANQREWESRRRNLEEVTSIQSTYRHVESVGNTGGPPSKPKYYLMTDSGAVLWRKGEKNPGRGVK